MAKGWNKKSYEQATIVLLEILIHKLISSPSCNLPNTKYIILFSWSSQLYACLAPTLGGPPHESSGPKWAKDIDHYKVHKVVEHKGRREAHEAAHPPDPHFGARFC